jgi:hypothetical protein
MIVLCVSKQEMIERYSSQLDLSLETVMAVVEELRLHALKKLAAEKRFRETGIAVLRIKYAGQVPDRVSRQLLL